MTDRKRWTIEDDRFIVMFFDAVGPMIGPHDLGCTEAQVTARAKRLRDKGGWALLERAIRAEAEYRIAMGARGSSLELLEETAEAMRSCPVRALP